MKFLKYRICLLLFLVAGSITAFSCSGKNKNKSILPPGGPYPTILIAQAQFFHEKKEGKDLTKPGPALLTLRQKTAAGWKDIVIEDPQSNVFHKAMVFNDGSQKKIVTIGGMQAALKLWEFKGDDWQQTVLWNPVFGGEWNRLRDIAIGDVTGKGKSEFVIATHDQGIVAVAMQEDKGWEIKEIDREPNTFVHEVAIGDVDGDGKNEFFVTPRKPNKAEGGPQPGKVIMYKWNGTGFTKTVVDSFEKTHAKEILAYDIDGKGIATLFAVVEAETKKEGDQTVKVEPVKIKKYAFKNGGITSEVIATLDDFQCRFLAAGDVDNDGSIELVAAAMKTGIWMLKRNGTSWFVSQIDSNSSGYEHALCIADLDNDGKQEIYVASDDQKEFRMYAWNGKGFSKTVIAGIPENRITWNITTGTF